MIYNPNHSILTLGLNYELCNTLLGKGVKTVGQLMDIPSQLTYAQVFGVSTKDSGEITQKIREWMSRAENEGVTCAAQLKVGETVVENTTMTRDTTAHLDYPSDEDTPEDRSYRNGFKAGWEAAVKVMRNTLTEIDSAVSSGMK